MINILRKKMVKVNDLSAGQYSISKNTRCETPMLRSDLCDYRDVYVVVKLTITDEGDDYAKNQNKKLTFKNLALVRSCISKHIRKQCRRS